MLDTVPPTRAAAAAPAIHDAAPASGEQRIRALEQALRERESLLQELTAANRAKDEFLAMLGHELRNPLAPIVTALELMRMRGDGSTSREQAAIRRQLDHLLRLVDDLLDITRITRGKIELDRQPCDVQDVLARAAEMAMPLIDQRGHRLVLATAPALACEADQARLAQVVSNLLTNAARYTQPGGEIELATQAIDGELEIRVRDNGIGIPPHMLQPIFELFLQGGRPDLDRHEGGLGLGLALVKSLVEMHGGRVWAESAGLGHGSTFRVRLPGVRRLPLAAIPAAANDEVAAPAAFASGRATRVLVVDDNREAADFLAELLAAYGCDARVAYDPAAALQLLDHFLPDVAILDLGLPAMDGFELARRFRARIGPVACRLLALSGYGQPADRDRSAAAGFEAHLVKPVDAADIARLIRRA